MGPLGKKHKKTRGKNTIIDPEFVPLPEASWDKDTEALASEGERRGEMEGRVNERGRTSRRAEVSEWSISPIVQREEAKS